MDDDTQSCVLQITEKALRFYGGNGQLFGGKRCVPAPANRGNFRVSVCFGGFALPQAAKRVDFPHNKHRYKVIIAFCSHIVNKFMSPQIVENAVISRLFPAHPPPRKIFM